MKNYSLLIAKKKRQPKPKINVEEEEQVNLKDQPAQRLYIGKNDFSLKGRKEDFDIKMPNVGEYEKEQLLTFEKGYIRGCQKKITNTTADFYLDEETGTTKVVDGSSVVVGGIIADKKIKYTNRDFCINNHN